MDALLEPPTTTEELRSRADYVGHELEETLEASANPVEVRDQRFQTLRGVVMAIARSKAWNRHDLAHELLLCLEDLREAIEADAEGRDPQWKQRAALQRMLVVVKAMARQIDHDRIDRPEEAARLIAQVLESVDDDLVASLMDVDRKMLPKYRSGSVGEIRKNPERMVVIGQLVYELQYTLTLRGIVLWFDTPRPQLGGRTPRQLLDEDPVLARERLIALARGGRGQLDVGSDWNVDRAA